MNSKTKVIGLMILAAAVSVSTTAAVEEIHPSIQRLEARINREIQGMEGTLGLSARHLESGEKIAINGEEYFPMASVFKVPVFVELMARVQEGALSLEDEVRIQPTDQHLGSGMLSGLDAPGIVLSVRNLANLMMRISDNSATDILFNRLGAENINARLRSLGIEGIKVDRSCQHLIMDAIGLDFATHGQKPLEDVLGAYREMVSKDPEAGRENREGFSRIKMDQATPEAMTSLLSKIYLKEILDEKSCTYIIDVMLECDTGPGRIRGNLPRGTAVAHKTGTIGGTVNDVGIIFLPDGLGHVALSIFTKDTGEGGTSDVEKVIAEISRLVYDYFYFTAGCLESGR
jgi:beta-lactamase class A